MGKTGIERLRGLYVEWIGGDYLVALSDMIQETADQIEREHAEELAALEPRLMPESMEWPRFEDVERVEFGSAVDGLDSPCEKFIFTRSMGGVCQLQDAGGNMVNVLHGYRIMRNEPEVLGADGLPLKVGDTVYLVSGSEPYRVESLPKREDGMIRLYGLESKREKLYCYYPDVITHTPPDTQERIDDDATMPAATYCVSHGLVDSDTDVDEATLLEMYITDLLSRQRELDKREMGGK